MAEDKVYLLTQEAYNKMKEELAHRAVSYTHLTLPTN